MVGHTKKIEKERILRSIHTEPIRKHQKEEVWQLGENLYSI